MTDPKENLLTKIILETATADDFYAVSRQYSTLSYFFEQQKPLLSSWHLSLISGMGVFDIVPVGTISRMSADVIYRISEFSNDGILYISHRGVAFK